MFIIIILSKKLVNSLEPKVTQDVLALPLVGNAVGPLTIDVVVVVLAFLRVIVVFLQELLEVVLVEHEFFIVVAAAILQEGAHAHLFFSRGANGLLGKHLFFGHEWSSS